MAALINRWALQFNCEKEGFFLGAAPPNPAVRYARSQLKQDGYEAEVQLARELFPPASGRFFDTPAEDHL